MPIDLDPSIVSQIQRLATELDARAIEHNRLLPYIRRCPDRVPIPEAIVAAKLVTAYTRLMAMAITPWGKLVVVSKLDRLEVNGVTDTDKAAAEAVWEQVWQENAMDLESKLGHKAALLDGRCHATVWPTTEWVLDGETQQVKGSADGPTVQLDDAATMVVEYVHGSRQRRVGALRRWTDADGRELATLYRRDGLYKFQGSKDQTNSNGRFKINGLSWEKREVDNEPWPLPNPLGTIPVVEIASNRELAAGEFTTCVGEFSDHTGLIDRINLLTFLGLAVAVSMSFPLRILIGDKILRDDDGVALPPFEAYAGGVSQLEDPQAKIAEFKAADRGQLSIFGELAQLAAATSTPRHYFPSDGSISNVAAETIRAFEGPLHAAIKGSIKPSLSEGWEEVHRLGGMMLPNPVKLSQRASMSWANHESRSLAEQADAFSKLIAAEGVPWQMAAELALGLGQDQIRRYEADAAFSPLAKIIAAARQPAAPNGNALATANGN